MISCGKCSFSSSGILNIDDMYESVFVDGVAD